MSDSQAKENKVAPPITKKIITDGFDEELGSFKKAKPLLAYIVGAVAVVGLIWFAGLLFVEYQTTKNLSKTSVERVISASESNDAPISILPDAPDGVTIIEKQAELSPSITTPQISVTSGAVDGKGFAMDFGASLSFAELSARFSKISIDNGPQNFNHLEPRAVLTETVSGLEAKLLVGPFENEQLAIEACEVLSLPVDVVCKTSIFEGELIARE